MEKMTLIVIQIKPLVEGEGDPAIDGGNGISPIPNYLPPGYFAALN